jgi:hypothetical protein
MPAASADAGEPANAGAAPLAAHEVLATFAANQARSTGARGALARGGGRHLLACV